MTSALARRGVLVVSLVCLAAIPSTSAIRRPSPVAASAVAVPIESPVAATPSALAARPNIVLILMDDASMDLVQTMRSAAHMSRLGAFYQHAFVVDSLCCVSRASLHTGQYPHQTGVRTNGANLPNPVGPIGGWQAFRSYGNTGRSVNTRLRQAGYRTAFIGKYLNGYEPAGGKPPATIPSGWSDFRPFFSSAYDEWDFW